MLLLISGHRVSLFLIYDDLVIMWTFDDGHCRLNGWIHFFRAANLMIKKKWFYAVAWGRQSGIYTSYNEAWQRCEGLKRWWMRKWDTKQEAKEFMEKANPIPKCVTPSVYRPCTIPTQYTLWSTENPPRALVDHHYPIVFTDGSRKDGQSGAGIFWGEGAEDNRAVRLPSHYSVAASELAAIVVALYTAIIIRRYPRVLICSDHFVSLKSAIQWSLPWQQNGWIKRTTGLMIRNATLVRLMAHLCKKSKCAVYFLKVNSRKGDKNWNNSDNKKADELAESGRTSDETLRDVLLNFLKY